MKTNVAVVFGCRSVEHEVSIISAVQAMRAVNKEKYNTVPVYVAKTGEMYTGYPLFEIEEYKNLPALIKKLNRVAFVRENGTVVLKFLDNTFFKKNKDIAVDVAFPIVHGTNCEDGAIAGLFEFLDLPYVGCDILSAACGMDKAVFKDVLSSANLPVLDCVRFTSRTYSADKDKIINEIKSKIGFPVIVKPTNLGSSVGISKADDEKKLREAIDNAADFSDEILAEHAVQNLREINCSVLGDECECIASVCEEPFHTGEILSYGDKYLSNSSSKGMASLGRKLPADIPTELSDKIRNLSCRVFKALGCSGVVRIDYLLDDKTKEVYVNEINTIPGSLAFYLWDASGVKYGELIDRLISYAFTRQRRRNNLSFSIDTNILSGVSFGKAGQKGSKF